MRGGGGGRYERTITTAATAPANPAAPLETPSSSSIVGMNETVGAPMGTGVDVVGDAVYGVGAGEVVGAKVTSLRLRRYLGEAW